MAAIAAPDQVPKVKVGRDPQHGDGTTRSPMRDVTHTDVPGKQYAKEDLDLSNITEPHVVNGLLLRGLPMPYDKGS